MSDEYQDCLDEDELDALEPERCETCGGFLIFIETQTTNGIDGDNDVSVQDVYHCEQCGAEQRVDLPF